MNKKGFVFIETIIVVIVLTSSLLLLYTSFNKILQSEKTRVNYDDINYIYRTYYVKTLLDSANFTLPMRDLDEKTEGSKGIHFVTIGLEYSGLFDGLDNKKTLFRNMINDFEIEQIILLNPRKLDNIKRCTKENSQDTSYAEYSNCNMLYTNLSDGMVTYLKALNIDLDSVYLLVIEYKSCNNNNICKNYYGWVGV